MATCPLCCSGAALVVKKKNLECVDKSADVLHPFTNFNLFFFKNVEIDFDVEEMVSG